MPEGDGGGTRARQRAVARSRLLRAAKEVFEEKGFVEVRVADIAARAEVSHGLFYHYFDSKQHIFRELVTAADQHNNTMDVLLDGSSATTPYERLQKSIRLHFERYRDNARLMDVIEEVSRYDDEVKAAREALHHEESKRLVHAIGQLQRHGLADQRLDPAVAAVIIGSMTWRFAERWLLRGEVECEFDEGVAQFMILLMNALQVSEGNGARGRNQSHD